MAYVCPNRACVGHNVELAVTDDAPSCATCGRRAVKKYFGFIFHDLRRTFVTDAEDAGAPRSEVMMITGHKTESVYRRYKIENPRRRREAVAEILAYRAARKNRENLGKPAPAAPMPDVDKSLPIM